MALGELSEFRDVGEAYPKSRGFASDGVEPREGGVGHTLNIPRMVKIPRRHTEYYQWASDGLKILSMSPPFRAEQTTVSAWMV